MGLKKSTLATSQKFVISASDISPQQRLKIPSLADYMQEAAWNNAAELGFSVYDLQKSNVTWVLYRMQLFLDDIPTHKQSIYVETWPSGMDKLYVYRDFRIYNLKKIQIGSAASSWVVLDINKRKLVPVPPFLTESVPYLEHDHLPRPSGKLPKMTLNESSMDIQVRWHHLDTNHHTNYSYYFQWILDVMPAQVLTNNNLTALDIIFKSESRLMDILSVACQPTSQGKFLHRICNKASGKEVVTAESIWR